MRYSLLRCISFGVRRRSALAWADIDLYFLVELELAIMGDLEAAEHEHAVFDIYSGALTLVRISRCGIDRRDLAFKQNHDLK